MAPEPPPPKNGSKEPVPNTLTFASASSGSALSLFSSSTIPSASICFATTREPSQASGSTVPLAAFAEYGTLSQTAKVLHLSQPALSRSMQKLEEELQIPLFDRHKNKIALNENGILAAEYAKKILNLSQDMTTRLRLFDQSRRTITVGSCAPAPIWEITPLLYDLYPDMPISVELRPDELHTFVTELSRKHMHPATNRAIIPITDREAYMEYYLSYQKGRVQKIRELLRFLKIPPSP